MPECSTPRGDRAVGGQRGKGVAIREDSSEAGARRCAGGMTPRDDRAVGGQPPESRRLLKPHETIAPAVGYPTSQRGKGVVASREDFGKAAASRRLCRTAGAAITPRDDRAAGALRGKGVFSRVDFDKAAARRRAATAKATITPRDDRAVGGQRGKGVVSRVDFGKAGARWCAMSRYRRSRRSRHHPTRRSSHRRATAKARSVEEISVKLFARRCAGGLSSYKPRPRRPRGRSAVGMQRGKGRT